MPALRPVPFFFFNDTATTEIYTLSLHDALPICTTRTVVAAVDRGNYPVVSFQTADGDTQDWYPSLIAARGDTCLYGLDAVRYQDDPAWALLRSFKRQLTTLGPAVQLTLDTGTVSVLQLLTSFLVQL